MLAITGFWEHFSVWRRPDTALNRSDVALIPGRQIVGGLGHLLQRPVQAQQVRTELLGQLVALVLVGVALGLDSGIIFRANFALGIAQSARTVGGSHRHRARTPDVALYAAAVRGIAAAAGFLFRGGR